MVNDRNLPYVRIFRELFHVSVCNIVLACPPSNRQEWVQGKGVFHPVKT